MTVQAPPIRTEQQNNWMHMAADRIRQHPSSYSQAHWLAEKGQWGTRSLDKRDTDLWLKTLQDPECGTVACLKGQLGIVMALDGVKNLWSKEYGFDLIEINNLAGFTKAERALLFGGDADGWPTEYRNRWEQAYENEDPEGMAKAAADLLDDIADGLIWYDQYQDRWVTIEQYIADKEKENARRINQDTGNRNRHDDTGEPAEVSSNADDYVSED